MIRLNKGNSVTKDEIISRAERQTYGIDQWINFLFKKGNKEYYEGVISGNFYFKEI